MSRAFAIDRLCALQRAPGMWAHTREAFAAQVALLLELLDVDPRKLVQREFEVPHTCAADPAKLVAPVDDLWARGFIDQALALAGIEHTPMCRLLDGPSRKRGMPFTCICGAQKP